MEDEFWLWKPLYEQLQSAIANLKFDANREPTPKTKLKLASRAISATRQSLDRMRVTKLGRYAVRSEAAYAFNAVEGILQGKRDKAIKNSRINEILPVVVEKLEAIASEVRVKAEIERVDNQIRANKKLEDAARPDASNIDETMKPKIITESATFNSFQQAMRQAMGDMAKIEEEKKKQKKEAEQKERENDERLRAIDAEKDRIKYEREGGDYVNPKNGPAVSEIRDTTMLTDFMKRMQPELRKLQTTINKAKLGVAQDFVMVRAPLGLITNPQLQMQKLDSSNIKYDYIPFPGVSYGANPGGRREFIPHLFVFHDQLLVAFTNEAADSSSAKKVKSTKKLGKKKGSEGDGEPLTRSDIVAMINQRTGKNYNDVLGTGDTAKQWIVNRKFPGVKFIWLLQNHVYSKIGPLSIEQASLPF